MSLSVDQAFQILEVPSTASWEEVRQAYRELAKVWHPDRFHDDPKFQTRATKKIQDINAAYQLLEQHYQKPPPTPPQPKQNTNDEMFERWAKDTEQQQQRQSTSPPSQSFPTFSSLEDLVRYFSLNLPYKVYPCRIERSNNTSITPEKAVRISIVAVVVVAALTWLTGMPSKLLVVVGCIAMSLMAVEWLGRKLAIPDALILTELGVTMVEGIVTKDHQFTATTAHTFLYEHLREVRWNEEEISFSTVNGLRFSFTPTINHSLTVPDTRHFKSDVYSAAQVIALMQNKSA